LYTGHNRENSFHRLHLWLLYLSWLTIFGICFAILRLFAANLSWSSFASFEPLWLASSGSGSLRHRRLGGGLGNGLEVFLDLPGVLGMGRQLAPLQDVGLHLAR
jgi:hypothetical protein